MTRPTPTELEAGGHYRLLDTLHHRRDVLPFVQRWLRRPSPVVWGYGILLAGQVLATLAVIVARVGPLADAGLGSVVAQLAVAVALNLSVLVVLHEGIHALAYKLLGAPSVSFGADWQRLVFYAVADGFVVRDREYVFAALLPLVDISVLGLATVLIWPATLFAVLAALALHTLLCAGDIALINYVWAHRRRPLYTYDDVTSDMSYFYEEYRDLPEGLSRL